MPSRTSQREIQALPSFSRTSTIAQALLVMTEPAGHQRVEHALTGVAERRVPEVVAERNGLGQFLVQLQHLRDGPRDLRHLERVRQTGPVVIAGGCEEHLRLVLQPPERLAVNDPIAIVLKRRAHIVFGLGAQAAARLRALRGLRRQHLPLALLELLHGWLDNVWSSRSSCRAPAAHVEIGRERLPEIRKRRRVPRSDAAAHARRRPASSGTYSRE